MISCVRALIFDTRDGSPRATDPGDLTSPIEFGLRSNTGSKPKFLKGRPGRKVARWKKPIFRRGEISAPLKLPCRHILCSAPSAGAACNYLRRRTPVVIVILHVTPAYGVRRNGVILRPTPYSGAERNIGSLGTTLAWVQSACHPVARLCIYADPVPLHSARISPSSLRNGSGHDPCKGARSVP